MYFHWEKKYLKNNTKNVKTTIKKLGDYGDVFLGIRFCTTCKSISYIEILADWVGLRQTDRQQNCRSRLCADVKSTSSYSYKSWGKNCISNGSKRFDHHNLPKENKPKRKGYIFSQLLLAVFLNTDLYFKFNSTQCWVNAKFGVVKLFVKTLRQRGKWVSMSRLLNWILDIVL